VRELLVVTLLRALVDALVDALVEGCLRTTLEECHAASLTSRADAH
jgi:hypothetical protein